MDRDSLAKAARDRSEELAALQEELIGRAGGAAYMLEQRLKRLERDLVDQLAGELVDDVHARL